MIRFEQVDKAFGSKQVLNGLDLVIPDGQTTVILGFSGTGNAIPPSAWLRKKALKLSSS